MNLFPTPWGIIREAINDWHFKQLRRTIVLALCSYFLLLGSFIASVVALLVIALH